MKLKEFREFLSASFSEDKQKGQVELPCDDQIKRGFKFIRVSDDTVVIEVIINDKATSELVREDIKDFELDNLVEAINVGVFDVAFENRKLL